MSDSDLLQRAVTKLREHAAKALPGPWHSMDNGDRFMAGADDDDENLRYIFGEPAEHGDSADYCALMHPPVALALADWLAAVEYSRTPWRCDDPQCGDSTWDHDCDPQPVVTQEGSRAIVVARAVLREVGDRG